MFLQDALAASFKAKSADEVTQITRDLLAQLDDPYTRLLQEEEEEALAAEEEGKVWLCGGVLCLCFAVWKGGFGVLACQAEQVGVCCQHM